MSRVHDAYLKLALAVSLLDRTRRTLESPSHRRRQVLGHLYSTTPTTQRVGEGITHEEAKGQRNQPSTQAEPHL